MRVLLFPYSFPLVVKYYFLYEDCYFENKELLNIYKSVLFTEGGNYTPESAKRGYNFSVDSEEVYNLKNQLKKEVADQNYHMEKIYMDLRKLFILRKNTISNPAKNILFQSTQLTR